jgi:2-polyprenyl-3-methyl-5-hydroxy-6-metoxy-1,4-benzoquinol methylase
VEHTVCNLCGADRPTRVHRNFERDISRCRSCRLVYAGPTRLTREETWTRYNPTYFADEYLPALGIVNGHVDLAAIDARYARMLAWLASHRPVGTLLEVGCGAGLFLKAAERAGWSVSGLDVMTAGVDFARTVLGLNVSPSAVEDADLQPGSYDVVALFDVIEHISNPKQLLAHLRTLLRPGGCLVLSTPNVDGISRRALGSSWAVLNPGEHLFYFSETTLSAMLKQAGYVDVSFDRHYAGAGRYETLLPTHSFAPSALRTRVYTAAVNALPSRALGFIQARGWADSLYAIAHRPGG